MVSMTLSIPEDLKKRMRRHSHVKWSDVARAAIRRQLDDWERMESLASKSRLTQKDVDELSAKADGDMRKHVEALMNEIGHRR